MEHEQHEKLIRLADVPGLPWLPTRSGKAIHLATVYRWVQRGIGGRRLRMLRVGGGLATTESWLMEFFSPTHTEPAERRTSRQRQRAIQQAERELAAAGI